MPRHCCFVAQEEERLQNLGDLGAVFGAVKRPLYWIFLACLGLFGWLVVCLLVDLSMQFTPHMALVSSSALNS